MSFSLLPGEDEGVVSESELEFGEALYGVEEADAVGIVEECLVDVTLSLSLGRVGAKRILTVRSLGFAIWLPRSLSDIAVVDSRSSLEVAFNDTMSDWF